MSTRSKTRLAAASTSKDVIVKQEQKPKSRANKPAQPLKTESDQQEKENVKVKAPKGVSKAPSTKKNQHKVPEPQYCTCQRGDDGSPMVFCGGCSVWYHFDCVDLDEKSAGEINVYVCPSCAESTGLRTAMVWEGPEALEESVGAEPAPIKALKKKSVEPRPKRTTPVHLPSETEDDLSSADEYVAEDLKSKVKNGKRPIRRLSISSESATSDDGNARTRRVRAKISASPAPSHRIKRKNDHSSHTPPTKRLKPSNIDPIDDPTRKYCLGKLEELFRDIFLKYPHVRTQNGDDVNQAREKGIVEKPLDDLTEEEKTILLDESKEFAVELEKCVFDIYSEPDKHGNPSAGSNYKDRFRMLQFNLSKNDRVVIHRRIASFLITPKEISLMSSTDLANEETKESIKLAEKEALAYSILTPTAIPRAKITHKGLEDIEDVHGEVTSIQDQERARLEEEERRERERMERLRLRAQKRQRTASTSVPPESPVVHQDNSRWGAPPPVPLHAMSPSEDPLPSSPTTLDEGGPSSALSFGNTGLDATMYEPEIDLADFLNMDDETPTTESDTHASQVQETTDQPIVVDAPHSTDTPTSEPTTTTTIAPPATPTGISPFAAKSETPTSTSFNLNTLWTAPPKQEIHTPTPPPPPAAEQEPPQVNEEVKDMVLGSDTSEADDQDFDMFLDEKDQPMSAEALQATFDALPKVWSGKINMPLDSTIPQETPVIARQMGGRSLGHDSILWKTLFPSDLLRIDGRVPVENSGKFLLQMRMNATKELIAVAFSPASESNDIGFRLLSDFLIAKGRHGLVFPWGNRPKDYHPGRELYIIPLLSSDPLPDYMELLDELHLPKIRKFNYLVGIWVLNKGKLAPPPAPPTPSIPQLPLGIHLPKHNLSPPVVPVAPLSSPAPPPPLPATIAAEVASLTPEQIQLMIRTLSGNATIPLPLPTPPQPQPMPPPVPPQPHTSILPPGPSQPWTNPVHAYGGTYHPPLPPSSHINTPPPPPLPPHHTPHAPTSWDRDRRDYGHQPRPGSGYDRGGDRSGDRNGWRGRGRGRGRGGDIPNKPLDSGWPRRQRNDSGPPGPSSPGRRW
ncbi:hypothetical protein BDZ94DRAFT_1213427 [Collybia nuda]|uniref:Transcription factor BYE1 n=1 Tax=Collybia nuda TaxID=64659 RepID=A0A9P6CHD2_9AGAR|nr:hypothetical protein BDZ94DRAFT_1213427 [Collybia nuda]